jgi:hypothetical protein
MAPKAIVLIVTITGATLGRRLIQPMMQPGPASAPSSALAARAALMISQGLGVIATSPATPMHNRQEGSPT